MHILTPVAVALLHFGVLGSAENSIRLKASTLKLVEDASSGVRRYQASVQLDESMFEMTEVIMGMEETMMFIKSRSEKRGDDTIVWSGVHQATDTPPAFLTISQNSRGHISGSMKTASISYSLLTVANGDLVVTATDRSRYKHVPAEVDKIGETEIPAVLQGRSTIEAHESMKIDVRSKKVGLSKEVSYGPASDLLKRKQKSPSEPDQRDLQTIFVADVMVLVTNEAMCQFVGEEAGCPLTEENAAPIISYLLFVTQTEVNDGMQLVGGISGIELVSIVILPEDFNVLKPDVPSLVFIDGSCDIRDLRVEEDADLVAVITGDNLLDDNGITLGIAEIEGFASITGLFGLVSGYTFTHEIGHSYGCLHDRPTFEETGDPFHPYAHGFQLIPFFRTVMAYQCDFDFCPLELQFFSNPVFTFDGLPLGDEDHDNVRQLNDAAFDVSRRSVTATCSLGELNPQPTQQPTSAPIAGPVECDPTNPFCSIADIILQLLELISLIFGN